MKLAVGDMVVYGTHGIGRIRARETQVVLGTKREVVVLELSDGLTATLPVERAQEQLRPILTETDMRRVKQVLKNDSELSSDPWLSRRRDVLAKLTAGDPAQLAEIVSDGAQRERALQAKGGKTQLSPGEREIFVQARRLLAEEIALSRGIEQEAADAWIDEQLSRRA